MLHWERIKQAVGMLSGWPVDVYPEIHTAMQAKPRRIVLNTVSKKKKKKKINQHNSAYWPTECTLLTSEFWIRIFVSISAKNIRKLWKFSAWTVPSSGTCVKWTLLKRMDNAPAGCARGPALTTKYSV